MIYAPHTLELTRVFDTKKINKLKNRAYEKSKKKHRVVPGKDKHTDLALADKGIKIEYHDGV